MGGVTVTPPIFYTPVLERFYEDIIFKDTFKKYTKIYNILY